MNTITFNNQDRASAALSALAVMRKNQDAKSILEAYCQNREGSPELYDELVDVASDAVSDTLHALSVLQFAMELPERVVQPNEMDLTDFYQMISIMAPYVNAQDFNAFDFERRAFSHFIEEQEEELAQ